MNQVPALVLASASPRRAELLSRLGLRFQVDPPDVSEEVLPGESPVEHVERLSLAKALEVSRGRPSAIVVGGDTVVVSGGEILGKPRDEEDAVRTLMSLSGRTHSVVSGLALVFPGGAVHAGSSRTQVRFLPFQEPAARAYVATGEPMDKAGAYGIQGLGSALVQEVRGDYHTVVGLPIPLLLRLLEAGGFRYEFGALAPIPPE